MDDVDTMMTSIVDRIAKSSLSDTEKADLYAQISVGMHTMVWPILLTHVPKYLLDDMMNKTTMSVEEYRELFTTALSNPSASKELHDELIGALTEVDDLIRLRLEKAS